MLREVAWGLGQLSSDKFQGWRAHSLSRESVPVLHDEFFPDIERWTFPCCNAGPLPCHFAARCCRGSDSIFSTIPFSLWKTAIRCPPQLTFPRLNKPSIQPLLRLLSPEHPTDPLLAWFLLVDLSLAPKPQFSNCEVQPQSC